DLLTTVTGRIGYAQGKWLAYAKGDWAGADVELTLFDRATPVRAPSSGWVNGWTVGGGGEYAICKNLLLGVEYDYAELSKEDQLADLSLRRGRRGARRRRRYQSPIGDQAAQLPLRRLEL